MTKDEFFLKFRPALTLLATEAFVMRKVKPSELGQLFDNYMREMNMALEELWKAISVVPEHPVMRRLREMDCLVKLNGDGPTLVPKTTGGKVPDEARQLAALFKADIVELLKA